MKNYFLKTYGCQMNKHDSERILGLLNSCGYKEASSIYAADLVVYYTCCVRESANEKFYGQLTSTSYKEGTIVAVGGCLGQKEGNDLLKRFKEIDLVFGTQNLKELPNLLSKVKNENVCNTDMLFDFNSNLPSLRKNKYKAWVAVNRGCDNHCTYCIVPSVRGGEISRNINDIKNEIYSLIKDEVVEITLLGQNVNSYGKDIYSKPSFSKLLQEISETGIKRIRYTTSHPKDLTKDIILTMKKYENICNHIHLPVQAGSNTILKKMGRKYTMEYYLELLETIRSIIPDISITTDIMVGFPGETESDFEDTLSLVRAASFDGAYSFIYSARVGTVAATMKEQLSYEQKLIRHTRLLSLQDSINFDNNKKCVGNTEEVLVQGPTRKDKSILGGRTMTNKLVHLKGNKHLTGKLIHVKIKEARPFFLIGDTYE